MLETEVKTQSSRIKEKLGKKENLAEDGYPADLLADIRGK